MEFNQRLNAFQEDGRYPQNATDYCLRTWLTLYKEKIVAYWVNKILHFGHSTTSVAESSHASVKAYLVQGSGDLTTVFRKLRLYWENQTRELSLERAKRQNKVVFSTLPPLFKEIQSKIVPQAARILESTLRQLPKPKSNLPVGPLPAGDICGSSCDRLVLGVGLPCRHILHRHIQEWAPLTLQEIDIHWWWYRPAGDRGIPASPEPPGPQDPLPVRAKGRPKGSVSAQGTVKVVPRRKGAKAGGEVMERCAFVFKLLVAHSGQDDIFSAQPHCASLSQLNFFV